MKKFLTAVFTFSALITAVYGCAEHEAEAKKSDGYAVATVPGMSASSAYMTLCNDSAEAKKLVSVSSIKAKSTEIHTMEMVGEKMKMRQLENVEIPAGECAEFKAGGNHVMLMGLVAPLKAGETLDLTLSFEDGSQMIKSVPVVEKQ